MEAFHGSTGSGSLQVQIIVEPNEDDIFTSAAGTPVEEHAALSPENLDLSKQRAYLDTYLKSLPYPCETEEQMQAHLEYIVGRIAVCVETKNWMVLNTWDGVLECWLLMRYTVPKSLRAALVRLHYELCILPGIEPRVTRGWIDMTIKLLGHKLDGRKRLENMAPNYLNLAENCKHYFSPDDIPDMLEEFVPVLNQEVFSTMIIPVMASFLPVRRPGLYIPMLFKIWEVSNSNIVDDRMIELVGSLAETHVAGAAGDTGPKDSERWKDVGIWTENQWSFLVGKALASMNVPVGGTKGMSTTGAYADMKGGQSSRVKKMANRVVSLARLFVNSMSVDGPSRADPSTNSSPASGTQTPQQPGYLAGSRALDSLDRLITSTETYFHPSNSGLWSISLSSFVASLAVEFAKRWQDEEQPICKTPAGQRLTPAIRRAFVSVLRTPVLLAMFAKDLASMVFAQAAIRYLAVLEPRLLMPELLERAYGGLESINETHRTTAVLSMLVSITQPLANEKIYLGGQKHIVPLLELCIPGIDLNDPNKTMYTAAFIGSIAQNIKIGDLSSTQSGVPLSSDEPPESVMDIDPDIHMPDGSAAILSREEERTLVRESTAGFADWVTSFVRRVLALYENLPEEGGKSNTTGGRTEENVLKSLRSALDMVFLHLSAPLFDLVLRIVYDYATTNAKSNAVKAFGQLVASLSRANVAKTVDKFLPFCVAQIKEELKHGASSIRTTSASAAVPSDTTLHWNIAILRACFQYDSQVALQHRETLLDIISALQEKTLSERGYSSTGRMLSRLLMTLSTVYPFYGRFVNSEEWDSPEFNSDHNVHWGRSHKFQDVKIEWHTPSDQEIAFILEILDKLVAPALDKIEKLLDTHLTFCRHAWNGLPTLFKEGSKDVIFPAINPEAEVDGLVVSQLLVSAGFALTDPLDPRHQRAVAHRRRFGQVLHRAVQLLGGEHEGEDHIDAVLVVNRSIETYLTDYGLDPNDFAGQQKNYLTARESQRVSPKLKMHNRLILVRRAQLHHSSRVYLNALYRRRDAIDDSLIKDLAALSLSPYLRVRRQAQSSLHKVCSTFVRSTRMILPDMFGALMRGSDPDRMKGALYILWNKGTAMYAISDPKDPNLYGQYLLALLGCQHQEKASLSFPTLVSSLSKDALAFLEEESIRTDGYTDDVPAVLEALEQLKHYFSDDCVDQHLLAEAREKGKRRVAVKLQRYDETVASIVQLALHPTTHWRYVYWSLKFLIGLIRRDAVPSAEVAKLFMLNTTSPHSSLRSTAQKGIAKLNTFIKIRTYARSTEEAWLNEWSNPLQAQVPIRSNPDFYEYVQRPVDASPDSALFVDKVTSGFVAWRPSTKAYKAPPENGSPIAWEDASRPALLAIEQAIQENNYFGRLGELWAQESNKDTKPDVRADNLSFAKSMAKMLQGEHVDLIMAELEPLLSDDDRFKQRAAAEFVAGIARGTRHWPKGPAQKVWAWVVKWVDFKYKEAKPDTLGIWESCVNNLLHNRDPRRSPELISWILSLPTDFQSESAFSITKSLSMLGCFVDYVGFRDPHLVERHFELFLSNANIAYAELRALIAENVFLCITNLWAPCHSSVQAFLDACNNDDPLSIRNVPFKDRIAKLAEQLGAWKEERLPPPRVNQSQYDKVGLTLLRWVWLTSFSSQATLLFPFLLPLLLEFLQMTELSDNPELQAHSQAVLNIISAVTPPHEFIDPIVAIFVNAVKSSKSWRIRLHAMQPLVVFFYRNLLGISEHTIKTIMDVLLECLSDDNVEVREMASKTLSGIVRVSQRQSIPPLLDRFRTTVRKTKVPSRRDAGYAESIRTLHSAILGLCALIESFPYSVEKWMPPLTDTLATHATDPPPISTTIRKTASEFKKTHQDTWHKDQLVFDEDQLQNLSTMLVGTSYSMVVTTLMKEDAAVLR
ncbi:hypothetical protein K488DRAFT_83562 [Vararia minispora EC-137]|uniref:Uncharacterized protein n=1 Tax=Vararia minispora EC-137 TaxID=1314806 RepID=A0ACB8QT09_9AGAM|nr:hypothetical protein K488DRAFT_83562 [Vararia minispora EC-137]